LSYSTPSNCFVALFAEAEGCQGPKAAFGGGEAALDSLRLLRSFATKQFDGFFCPRD
jgi:hypothetical protein